MVMANETTERRIQKSSNFLGGLLLMVVAVLVVVVFVALRLFEWEQPTIKPDSEVTKLGQKGKVVVQITDGKSGIKEVRAVIRQGKKEAVVVERLLGRNNVLSQGLSTLKETLEIDAKALGLSDGQAELVLMVSDLSWWNWLRGNQAVVVLPVVFDTKPPMLRMVHSPNKIRSGGAGMIVYGANEEIAHSGVTIDGIFHPGYPITTRKDGVYGAMVGIPYDTEVIKSAAITGQDRAGNPASMPITLNFRPTPKKSDTIKLSDSFLNTKIPEFAQYYPDMKGSQEEQFLFVNNEVRRQNGERIKEICGQTDPEQHWQGRFKRMENSSPMAGFAQYRTYFYQDKEIDHQVHLGVDLASLERAEVKAANAGKVVYADYLGIYGNMVMIDHGQGVFSLYSHLSEITVQVGDMVQTDTLIGRTGTTGMAGGDHLHFAMLVNGVFVTPVEWWDEHWIQDNILLFMQEDKRTQ
jgi:murein DD-endopeptidase MepM/ murein hydrolase activator NlpD